MKRYTTLALVMALCASLLVGCGCSGNVEVTTTPTSALTTEVTTVPTTEAPTTEATMAPTTEPVTRPTTAPETGPTGNSGIMDDLPGTDGNMDAERGTVPQDSIAGNSSRRFK